MIGSEDTTSRAAPPTLPLFRASAKSSSTTSAPRELLIIITPVFMSKSLSSGLRVGFIAYADHFSEKITRGVFNIYITTSALNAEVVTELINTGIAAKIITEKREIAKQRNLIYSQYFEIQNPHENPINFFRWHPLQQKYLSIQFEKDAATSGVRIYHSNRFLVGKDENTQFIRISLVSATDSDELEKGLYLLKKFLLIKEATVK